MERQRPEYLPAPRSERVGIVWTVLLGIALAAALAGGVVIYLNTVAAWQHNRDARSTATQRQREAGNAAVSQQAELNARRQRAIAEFEATRAAEREARRRNNQRCINGVLFERIENGWRNIPGRRCTVYD